MQYIASVTTIAITLLIMGIFQIVLREKKPVPIVEFFPPYRLNPIEVAAQYFGNIKAKHLGSYFLYWAEKGFVKIENDKGKHLILYKLKNIETDNEYEASYFNTIFMHGDVFKTSEFYHMGSDFSGRIQKAMHNLIRYHRENINLFSPEVGVCRKVYAFLGIIPLIGYFTDLCAINGDYSFMLTIFFPFAFLFFWEIGVALAKTERTGLVVKVFISLISTIFFASLFFMEHESDYTALMNKIFVAITLLLFFAARTTDVFLKKRTKISYIFQCKIAGFKHYLEHAEEDKLNALVAEDPDYFKNIMAYCYVLEISNELVKNYGNVYLNVGDLEKSYDSLFTILRFEIGNLFWRRKK